MKVYNLVNCKTRDKQKYNDNHILNAINIPYDQLLTHPDRYLNKNYKYYIYCQKGFKSKKICQILNNSGYNTVNIIGGYEAWILNKI